ncbi:ribonuclease T [Halorhodospira halophila]|uniref:Ribonuclease T n=1 Tax=Halorhodospira halophila (strain DSM 244 / SL1) TaxID=349124 RepID=A1WUZ8_HALHL|nr:ribonuclease T [Halorhodospira halophila]ABM61510.1 RNAse T [Halorhodospira halophila SL1]MBK1728757.1 ribonuclease T [Halorhodospira halophila]
MTEQNPAQSSAADERIQSTEIPPLRTRFRAFLPVVVDVETGGLQAETDALLQIAAVILRAEEGTGRLYPAETHTCHVQPFEGARIDPKALELNGIDPEHPLRMAVPERDALGKMFNPVRQELRNTGCNRAVLVGHNAFFDLAFLNAAVTRTGFKRNPFHPFSSFDTATLGGLAYGQTVLAKAVKAAGIEWDAKEAHSAIYDAEKTAELFCAIVNCWDAHCGRPSSF